MKIILATGSPYRKEAFSFLNLDFTSESSNVDEQFDGRPEDPEDLVRELARLKAEDVASRYTGGIVIGFDSVGCCRGDILEKPNDRKEAFQRLGSLSGKTFQFFTGIHIINQSTGKTLSRVVGTRANMRNISDAEINRYLDQDQKYITYALGFDPNRHISSSFIKSIEGSIFNVTQGLPLEAIVDMLYQLGYSL